MHPGVQSCTTEASAIPINTVTIDVLRSIEARLTERGFLPEPVGPSFGFLWFIAETERNVFLWRNGMSIADADRFEFWVNLPNLIEKRLRQLQLRDNDNPFINPLWGVSGQNGDHAKRELEYLQAMKDVLKT